MQRLDDACLVERLEADQVRLHPLIREFASGQTPPDQLDQFRPRMPGPGGHSTRAFSDTRGAVCRARSGRAPGRPDSPCSVCARRRPQTRGPSPGACSGCSNARSTICVTRTRNPQSTLFAQQVRNRAVHSVGIISLRASAEQRLIELGQSPFPAAMDGQPRIAGLGSDAHRPWRLGQRGRALPRRTPRSLRIRRLHAQVLGPADRPASPYLRRPRSRGKGRGDQPRRPPSPLGIRRSDAQVLGPGDGPTRPDSSPAMRTG